MSLQDNNTIFKQATTDQEKPNRSCQGTLFEYRGDILESGHNGDSIVSEMNLFFRDQMRGLQNEQQHKQNPAQMEDPKDSGCPMVKQQGNNENSKEQEESQRDNESIEKKSINQISKSAKDGARTNTAIIQSSRFLVDRQSEVNSFSGNDSQLSIRFNSVRGIGEKEKVSKQQVEQIGVIDKITKEKIHTIDENAIFEEKPFQLKNRLSMALKTQEATANTQQNKNTPNFEKATNIINRLLNSSMNRMMRVQQHMKNLVQTLKLHRSNKDCSMLTTREYEIINDLSIFHLKHKKKKKSNWFVKKANILLKLSSKVPIFMPTDSMRVSWDIFQVFFTYIFLYIFSIFLFFAQDESDLGFIQKLSMYAFFFFLADVLINFNTAYFDKDIVISSRKQIAISYMFSLLFLTDCTSLFVLGAKIVSQSNSLAYNPDNNFWTYGLNILIFLKSNGMQPKRKRFDYVFTLRENQKHIIKLINQIISVITVAHIASIGWYFLGIQEERNEFEMSWLQKANLTSSTYSQKYIYSIYWAITTMTTVGYGDIAATNDVEALFIALNMIVFSCVFAYSINNIGFILQEIEKSSKQLNDNITTIQRYLNRKNVNISLKSRVRHYLSFLAQEQKDRNKEAEDSILNLLSNKLRDEITIEINTKILNSYHVFSSNFSVQTLRKLVFVMKEVLVSPNEIIFRDDDGDDQSIYFIQSGIIEIFHNSVSKNNQQSITQQLEANQIFGEISFFSGLARKASARSINLSTLYKIKREDFIEVLNTNQEDFERFKMIQEQIIFQNEYNSLFVECYTCKKIGHIAKFCPMTHHHFDRQFVVLKNNFSLFQERSVTCISRKTYSFKSSLQYIHSNKAVCQHLKENLQELNSEIFLMFKTEEDIFETESIDNSEFKKNEQINLFSSSSSSSSEEEESSQVASQFISKEKKERRKLQNKQLMSSPKEDQSDTQSQCISVTSSLKQKTRKSKSLEGQEIPTLQDSTEKAKRNKKKLIKSHSETEKNNKNQASLLSCDGAQISQESSIQKITGLSLKAASLKADSGNNRIIKPKLNKNQEIKQNVEQVSSTKCKVISEQSIGSNSDGSPPLDQQSAKLLKLIQMSLEQQNRQIKQQQSLQAQELFELFSQIIPKNSSKKIEDNNIEIPSKSMEIPPPNSYLTNKSLSQANEHPSPFFSNGPSQSQKKIHCKESNETGQSIENLLYPNSKYQEQYERLANRSLPIIVEKFNENNLTNLKSKQRLEAEEERKSTQKLSSLVTPLSHQQLEQEKTNNFLNSKIPQGNSQQQDQMMEKIQNLLGMPNQYVNLLKQVSVGLSFREMPSANQNQMDFFDQMRIFKKFFPNNNFDKVVIKLKSKLIEQKKLKKQKNWQKPRRLNIALLPNQTLNSLFYNTELGQIMQEPNYDSYRPTYLSYGIGMRKGMMHPIRHDPLSSIIN